jgi:nitrite reductase/ring-hydroxylating ferredoxin subunit
MSAAAAPLAVYERRVAASEERVWENVLDWEHLPWLHASSFREITCEEAGRWGWRARVALPFGDAFTIELRIDWDDRSYHTRTLDGPGTGTDIFTRVRRVDTEHTDVTVAFHVPGVPADRAESVGRGYVGLYTRLWDEDELMMQGRQAYLDRTNAPRRAEALPPIPLGPMAELRASLPRMVDAGRARFRVIEADGQLFAHEADCPHLGGPLGAGGIEAGAVVCPWHGYRFDCVTGRGPAGQRCRLPRTARIDERAGEAVLVIRSIGDDGIAPAEQP